MNNRPTLIAAMTALALAAADANAASITYQASDPGTAAWFATATPVTGDLAESATVTLAQGASHASSGSFTNLTNGAGGAGTPATTWFSTLGLPAPGPDKVHMDFGSSKVIGSVNTFSWQDFDNNDRRFPQLYQLYGSNAVAPATDDTTLGGATWDLLATVDSTTQYPYLGYNANFPDPAATPNPTPEQLAVTVTGDGGSNLGAYRHLLFRITAAPDPDGPGVNRLAGFSPFWSEIDVIEVPEPSSLALLIAGAIAWCGRKRSRADRYTNRAITR